MLQYAAIVAGRGPYFTQVHTTYTQFSKLVATWKYFGQTSIVMCFILSLSPPHIAPGGGSGDILPVYEHVVGIRWYE